MTSKSVYFIITIMVEGRIFGSLLGLAVCDAIGTTVEFMPPGSFAPVNSMVGGGKFNLSPGQVSSITFSIFLSFVTILLVD